MQKKEKEMRRMRNVYKLPPCSIYDVAAMEAWLTDLAADGLYLNHAGSSLFAFSRQTASYSCYRLEPVTDLCKEPTPDMQEDYDNAGWSFVCVLQKTFFVWRSIRLDADELHSDPVIHSIAYEQIISRLRKNAVCTAALALVLLSMFVCGLLLSPRPVTIFLSNASMPLLVIFHLMSSIRALQQFLRLNRLKRSLADGVPALHQGDYKKGLLLHRTAAFCIGFLALFLILMPLCLFAKNWKKSVPDVTVCLPYVPLPQLEGEDFSWHKVPYIQNGVDTCNNAEYAWSPLVPVHYEIYQQGEVQSVWHSNGTVATVPSAYTEYFRLSLPCLALPLYEEQLKNAVRLDAGAVVTELSHPGFDRIALACSQGFTQLFACRGRQVIQIKYWGYGRLSDHLDLLADAFVREMEHSLFVFTYPVSQ